MNKCYKRQINPVVVENKNIEKIISPPVVKKYYNCNSALNQEQQIFVDELNRDIFQHETRQFCWNSSKSKEETVIIPILALPFEIRKKMMLEYF